MRPVWAASAQMRADPKVGRQITGAAGLQDLSGQPDHMQSHALKQQKIQRQKILV